MHRSRSFVFLMLLLGAALAPVDARAQVTTAFTGDLQNVKRDSSGVIHLSLANCQATDPAKVSFTFTHTPAAGSRVRIFFSTNSNCPETGTSAQQLPIDLPNWTADQAQVLTTEEYLQENGYTVRQIFQNRQTAFDAPETCPSSLSEAVFICVRIKTDGVLTPTFKAIQFQLDTIAPEAPVLDSVQPLNGGLKANWSAPSNGERPSHYLVTATAAGQKTVTKQVDSSANSASTSIKGLVNDVPYTVNVVALDNAGLLVNDTDANASVPSNELEGTPDSSLPSDDSRESSGGCACTSAAEITWLGVLAVALLRKRRALI